MEEMTFIIILRNISVLSSIVGVLTGLDLFLGGKFISAATKTMEKKVDFDKILINLFSNLKRELDKERDGIDKIIGNTKVRVFFGGLFFILSICIILLLRKS